MIKLKIEEYCNDCDGFDPIVKNEFVYAWDAAKRRLTDTIVECSNCKKCRRIYEHIKRHEEINHQFTIYDYLENVEH